METPHARIKALQRALKVPGARKTNIPDLIALDQTRDPFYSGTPTDIAQAEWFAELFGDVRGAHLRRLHYRLVSRGNVVRADGVLYENDSKSWDYLNDASRHARYQGLIDPENIIDRRNPEPHIYVVPGFGTGPSFTYELQTRGLDRISTELENPSWWPLIHAMTEVEGYDYEECLQPYHVEVWAEKTTMNDALIPLCRELGTNYISGAGYQSVTAMVNLLRKRVLPLDKPCRVLYVSDYEDAGRNMPKQMARHMEFWSEKYGSDYDIRVQPVVMTAEQAERYPESPDSGAVELDAMEELDPGLLGRIVREHVSQFRDFELGTKLPEGVHQPAALDCDL